MIDHDVEQEFIDLIPYIYSRCIDIGIDPTLVVCQAALETSYFTSYNLRRNHNTAGIKSRTNTNVYAYYDTYKDGFEAQICHLALYCGVPQEGYYYSSRLDGWVTSVEDLAGTWAEDPYYANKILHMMTAIKEYEVEEPAIKPDKPNKPITEIIPEKEDRSGLSIIYNILNKNKKQSKAVGYLLSFVR